MREKNYGNIEYYVMKSITIYMLPHQSATPQRDSDKLWKTHENTGERKHLLWNTTENNTWNNTGKYKKQ